MDVDDIAILRDNHASWRLLAADSAPLVLSFLGHVFVEVNSAGTARSVLVAQLDDELHALNEGAARYPRPAAEYLDAWSERGWLRKTLPPGQDEPFYEATSALEKAYSWVEALRERSFVGTESRLHTIVELLRQMVHGAETDPIARVAELHRRRDEIDAEIDRVERGQVSRMEGAALRDRYQMFATTARDLLSDFREVAENFRALDRAARERIASWDGSKGELLDELLGDRTSIAASDQGRSFQAFYDFLLSRRRQDELAELLAAVHELDEVGAESRLRRIHHDWLDAAERTQLMVRLLSEQLRRFLDDQVWLENRRIMDLLRSIESNALEVRDARRVPVAMEIGMPGVGVVLPMERPLYTVSAPSSFESEVIEAHDELDASALFDQVHVDLTRLAETARTALGRRRYVTLSELLGEYPAQRGLAEIIGYLALSEDDLEIIVDDDTTVVVSYLDGQGEERSLRMAQVTLARRGQGAGDHAG